MTASLELVETPTIEDLTELARSEHRLVLETGSAMLQHAIRCGGALFTIRDQLPTGSWKTWMAEHWEASDVTAWLYIRLFAYREEIEAAGVVGIEEGRKVLVALPPVHRYGDLKVDAKEMHENGVSVPKIARSLGVSRHAVYTWLDPAKAEKYATRQRENARRRAALKRTFEEQQREQAVKTALVKEGQAFNEVYRMLTRMDDLLGQARGETEDREKRRAISEMHGLRNKMRDMAHTMLGVS